MIEIEEGIIWVYTRWIWHIWRISVKIVSSPISREKNKQTGFFFIFWIQSKWNLFICFFFFQKFFSTISAIFWVTFINLFLTVRSHHIRSYICKSVYTFDRNSIKCKPTPMYTKLLGKSQPCRHFSKKFASFYYFDPSSLAYRVITPSTHI